MNVGDLVRIVQTPPCVDAPAQLGIIVEEHDLFLHPLPEDSDVEKIFPELHYHVYDFSQKAILLYHSFELKILNKMSNRSSYNREEYR
jgi:hypothetical protein